MAEPKLNPEVLASPALPLLLDLERLGCRIELTPDTIIVEPASRLTIEQQAAVRTYARDLALLVGCTDPNVTERRDAFRKQLERAAPGRLPALLFRADVPYTVGACFSCGEELPIRHYGRCWRCSLAWRLACRLPVPAHFASALDAARVAS